MEKSMTTKSPAKSPESSPRSPEFAPKPPVLRLRRATENEELEEKQLDVLRFPDGPWRRHPDEIDDSTYAISRPEFPLDINVEDYRNYHQEYRADWMSIIRQCPRSERSEQLPVQYAFVTPQLVDMEHILETKTNEDDIEDAIERTFVYYDLYVAHPMIIVR